MLKSGDAANTMRVGKYATRTLLQTGEDKLIGKEIAFGKKEGGDSSHQPADSAQLCELQVLTVDGTADDSSQKPAPALQCRSSA